MADPNKGTFLNVVVVVHSTSPKSGGLVKIKENTEEGNVHQLASGNSDSFLSSKINDMITNERNRQKGGISKNETQSRGSYQEERKDGKG